MKTIAVASDHAGYELKLELIAHLRENNFAVNDLGCHGFESVDYPVYASLVGEAVTKGEADLGVLICGTGVGMSMAAGKIRGIRAVCCSDIYSAVLSREHNNSNVLCLGARVLGKGAAVMLLDAWLEAEFAGGKHGRRVEMFDK